jgi:hypothetical protein
MDRSNVERRGFVNGSIRRRDNIGQSYGLKLTAAGLKAIAVDDGSEETHEVGEPAQRLATALQGGDERSVRVRGCQSAPKTDSRLECAKPTPVIALMAALAPAELVGGA